MTNQVKGVTEKADYFFGSVSATSWPLVVLDIIIVSVLIYWVYLFLKETRAIRIFYGLLILTALVITGRLANLVLLNWILQYLMTMLIVAIPIVFQPELRSALEKLGRSRFIGFRKKESKVRVCEEIVIAAEVLAKEKIGALIVIQRKTGLRDFIEGGVNIDAVISAELLQSIFYPKSPLHDGSVIVAGDKIIAASATLPVSDDEEYKKLGFRHRAGVEITQQSDSISVIVSEETGSVSLAVGGKIERRISLDRLKRRLMSLISNE